MRYQPGPGPSTRGRILVALPLFALIMFLALTTIDLVGSDESLGEGLVANLVQVAVTTVLWAGFMWVVAWRDDAPLRRTRRADR